MNCPEFQELMSLLDGELPEPRAGELRKHLEDCPVCVELLESQDGLEKAWRESFRYPSRETFREMEERIAWNVSTRRRRRRLWNIMVPVAAAAAVLLLGVRLTLFGGPRLNSDVPPGIDVVNSAAERGFQVSEVSDADESTFHQHPAEFEEPEELLEMEEDEQTVDGELQDRLPDLTGLQSDDVTLQWSVAFDETGGGSAELSPGPVTVQAGRDAFVHEESLDGLLAGVSGGSGSSGDALGQQVETQEGLLSTMDQGDVSYGVVSLEGSLCGQGSGGGGELGHGDTVGTSSVSAGGGGTGEVTLAEETVSSELGEETSSDVVCTGYCAQNRDESEEEAPIWSVMLSSDTETADVQVVPPGGGDENGGVEGETDLWMDLSVSSVASSSPYESVEVVTGCQAAVWKGDDSLSGQDARLTFDRLGLPDSLTATLLDSLFPEWSLYIPFAFSDTVLIVAPGEVRSRLIGDDLPAEAE